MVIVVEGTKAFDNYETFMSGMTTALSIPNLNNEITVWSLGPHKINSFTAAFCNSAENYLKQKGFKVSFSKINQDWVRTNIEYVDYYALFTLPKEPVTKFFTYMEHQENVKTGIFRF